MKMATIAKNLLVGLALLGTTAFAASNKGTLQVNEPVTINGKLVPKGEYQVKWEGNGPDVSLSVMRGKQVVASAPGHLTELGQPNPQDSRTIKIAEDGSKSLTEIRFADKKYVLQIGDTSTQSSAAAAAK